MIGVTGDPAAVNQFKAAWTGSAGNYDAGRISRVAMSGVTALGRATAYQMEIGGRHDPWPGGRTGDVSGRYRSR